MSPWQQMRTFIRGAVEHIAYTIACMVIMAPYFYALLFLFDGVTLPNFWSELPGLLKILMVYGAMALAVVGGAVYLSVLCGLLRAWDSISGPSFAVRWLLVRPGMGTGTSREAEAKTVLSPTQKGKGAIAGAREKGILEDNLPP